MGAEVSDALFNPGPARAAPEKLSADRRRTLRNQQMLFRGIHPVTRVGLLRAVGGFTCGDCEHHVQVGGHAKTYHKCLRNKTSGAATDIRVSWPACIRFETVKEVIA
jgi:hypothetical protein